MLTPPSSSRLKKGVLPPWIWFWLIVYLAGFPTIWNGRIQPDLLVVLTGSDGQNPITYNLLERMHELSEVLVVDLAVIVSVILVFLPWIRTLYLQKRYQLTELHALPADMPPETLQILPVVSACVREYAPALILKYNAGGKVLPDRAFIYPLGYRRTGLALSGSLLALWEKDQLAAKAILLHEIEHYRHGDALATGAGSLLQTITRRWLQLVLIFSLVPFLLILLIEHTNNFPEGLGLPRYLQGVLPDDPLQMLFAHLQQFFRLDLPILLLDLLESIFSAAVTFAPIILATWCIEINADRFVIDTLGSTEALLKAMQQHAAASSWRRWVLSGMHHPPTALRRWLALRSKSQTGLVLLLLLFPAAWLLRLFFLIGNATLVYLTFLLDGDMDIGSLGTTLGTDIGYYFEGLVPVAIALAALLLLWPLIARYWERLFSPQPGQSPTTSYWAYLLSTLLVLLVSAIGLFWPRLPVSANAPESTPVSANSPVPTLVTTPTIPVQQTVGVVVGNYPILQKSYQGIVVNTTNNSKTRADATLSEIIQVNDQIIGNMTILPPLVGSGYFTGTVGKDGAIQFTVVPSDSSYTALEFTGTVFADGSMQGTYTIPGTNQTGTWQFQPR